MGVVTCSHVGRDAISRDPRDWWVGDVCIVINAGHSASETESPRWRNLRSGAVENWYRYRFRPLPEDQT